MYMYMYMHDHIHIPYHIHNHMYTCFGTCCGVAGASSELTMSFESKHVRAYPICNAAMHVF